MDKTEYNSFAMGRKRSVAIHLFGLMIIFLSLLLSGCAAYQAERERRLAATIAVISTEIQATIMAEWTPTVTATALPTLTPTPESSPTMANSATITPEPTIAGTPTADTRLPVEQWRQWPVVPEISDRAAQIYRTGVTEFKTNPKVFSKIGDCQSMPNVFMGIYDMDIAGILSDEDMKYQKAIDYFKGSFGMESYAVHDGMSVGSVLTTTWSDPKACQEGENALDCEIRIHNPSIMFINLGTNWINTLGMNVYYDYLTEIVHKLIDHGILPVLSSKADDVEGGHQINQVTAQVAREFDIPFYNFWNAAQYLKNNGLSADNPIYLSVGAWDYRNYYALQVLYAIGIKLDLFS